MKCDLKCKNNNETLMAKYSGMIEQAVYCIQQFYVLRTIHPTQVKFLSRGRRDVCDSLLISVMNVYE